MKLILLICLFTLVGCTSSTGHSTGEPLSRPDRPMAITELSPEYKAMVYQIMMAVDPNVFAYREPSLDERFGLK